MWTLRCFNTCVHRCSLSWVELSWVVVSRSGLVFGPPCTLIHHFYWKCLATFFNPIKSNEFVTETQSIRKTTRMWANAQRDGRCTEYRWRPLFNAAKFGWRPLLQCRAVTLPRHETRWNLLGCPKLPDRSEPLVGRSSPYCEDVWRRYGRLKSFFPIVDTCLSSEDIARQTCAMVPRWPISGDFFGSCIFSEPRAARFRPAF